MSDSFDKFSEGYTEIINKSLSVTGGDRFFYARERVSLLKKLIKISRPGCLMRILDFGCGDGATSLLLREAFNAYVVGSDLSIPSLEVARKKYGNDMIKFIQERDIQGSGPFDMVYCNGVFHHIPIQQHMASLKLIKDVLVPDGQLGFFENTPWNPGARYVMSKIPFDKDAVVLSPFRMKSMMSKCGFRICSTQYLFSIPPLFKRLYFLDPYLRNLPLGAQYLILAKKNL